MFLKNRFKRFKLIEGTGTDTSSSTVCILEAKVLLLTSKSAIMPCPCGLSREMVFDLDKRDRVPLVGGKCQNPLADGAEAVCGKSLGAHPLEQGNHISV